MADTLVRMCDSCGGVDDHPRHLVAYDPNTDGPRTSPEVVAQALADADPDAVVGIIGHLQDNSVIMKHMDCCRADGCPDGTCDEVTEGAENLKGDALRKHLVSLREDN
jgi:hypothetical protein